MNIGRNIAHARVSAGLTQQALADKLGTNRTTITQYETEARKPSLDRLQQIATTLGTTVSALTKEHENGNT